MALEATGTELDGWQPPCHGVPREMRDRLKYVAVCDGAELRTWEEIAEIAQLPADAICIDRTRVWNQRCDVYIIASAEFRETCALECLAAYAIIGRDGKKS